MQQDNPQNNPTNVLKNEATRRGAGRGAAAVKHEWQEEQKLGRFFSKLLGEVCFLGAEKVEFKVVGDSVNGVVSKDGRSIKNLTVKPIWVPLMKRWLTRRENPVGILPSKSDYGTPCACKVGDSMVSTFFQHSKNLSGAESLLLSRCVAQSIDTYAEQVVGRGPSRAQLERMSCHDSGTIVVCSTPGIDFMRKVAPVLGVTGAGYLGDFSEQGVRESLGEIASQTLTVISIAADDPTDALLQLRNAGVSLENIGFRGCVCTANVRKVCSGCAKKVSVDPCIMANIPEYLTTLPLDRYVVGRGCDDCGHKGYKGDLMVFSVAAATPPLVAWYAGRGGQMDLVKALVPHGLRPLFEEAYRRAVEGETTIESVLTAAKTVPAVYLEYWKKRGTAQAARAQVESASELTVEGRETVVSVVPVERTDGGDSAPLFPKVPTEKVRRERPMVLVVEDDEDQRSILELVLRGANYDVVQAANGAEALEAVQAGHPDIIISDLMMPVMDGSQMVAQLKLAPSTSQVPILMLTMVADEEREYALLNLGADDYCEKTIQRKVLLKRVENLLKRTTSIHQP